jgi:hypothetical protein
MSKNLSSISGSVLIASSVAILCSCSQKVSETSHAGDGYSERTEVVREGDRIKTTTVTSELDPKASTTDTVHINTDDNDNIQVKVPEDDYDGRTRVRAPFVKMDSDDNNGSVHVRAPFVKIDKGGYGDKVRVRIPGIHINTD